MLNMIKAEIKRLVKSKEFWVAIGVYLLVYCGCFFIQLSAQSGEAFISQEYSKEPGFYIIVDAIIASLNQMVQTFGFGFGSLILGIYFTSFVCSEYSSGYIKNTAMMEGGRASVIISKTIIAALISMIVILFNYIVGAILGTSFIHIFTIEPLTELLKNGCIMWLLSIALFSLVIFLSTFFHSKTAGIVILFLVSSGMLLPVFHTVFDLLHIPWAAEYTLSYFFSTVLNTSTIMSHAFVMSILFMMVYNILSILIIKRRDL